MKHWNLIHQLAPPLYSEAAPPVPPRTDEMMELSEDSLSSPASTPTTGETDLSSTSSNQFRDEQTSTGVSGDPLYDDIHLAGTVVQSQSNGDHIVGGGDSSGSTYVQRTLPASPDVSCGKTVVQNGFQPTQVSSIT